MADFNGIPAISLPVTTNAAPISGATLPWNGSSVPYQWTMSFDVTQQSTSATITRVALAYTGLDVNVGMWIGDLQGGLAWQIISITSKTDTTLTCIVQDIFRYNTYRDPTQSGNGAPGEGTFIVFELAEDGSPVIDPVPGGANPLFFPSIASRFSYIESQCDYPLNQPGFATITFNYGDIIAIDTATRLFVLADAAHEETTFGRVIAVDDTLTTFAVDPVRKVVDDFTYLPGFIGDVLYVDDAIPGQLTTSSAGGGAATFIKIRDNGQSTSISNTFVSPTSYVTTTGSVLTVNGISATVLSASGSGPISSSSPYTSLAQGSGYTNGTYTSVPLTGGFGTGATATIGVSGGKVHSILFTAYGTGYHQGDPLSASLGGTGSGFSVTISISSTLIDVKNAINTTSGSSGVSATITGTGPYYITSVAVDARSINFVDLNGTVTTDVGLISVQNGGTGAAMYIANPGTLAGGVTSFNTRTGAVTLTSTDVVDALGVQSPYTVFAGPATGSLSGLTISIPGGGYTTGTYTGVSLITVTGSGSGATATLVVSSGAVTSATIVSAGTGYAAGDLVTVNPSDLGGGSGYGTSTSTLPNPSSAFYWEGLCWNGSIWVAVAEHTGSNGTYPTSNSSTATSTDGVTWTLHGNNIFPGGGTFLNPIWTGSLFVMIESVVSPGSNRAWTSPDGIAWTARTMPSSHWWTSFAWNGTTMCAVSSGANNVGSRATATSSDGITWGVTTNAMPAAGLWQSIAAGPSGRFVALQPLALNGTSPTNVGAYSSNGTSWTSMTLPATTNWLGLAWNGSVFVATTYANTNIGAYSSDGISWTSMTLPSTQYWNGFTLANGSTFIIGAYASTIAATSTDGISWTTRTFPINTFTIDAKASNGTNSAILATTTGSVALINTASTVTSFYGSATLSLSSALPTFRSLVAADIPTLDDGFF